MTCCRIDRPNQRQVRAQRQRARDPSGGPAPHRRDTPAGVQTGQRQSHRPLPREAQPAGGGHGLLLHLQRRLHSPGPAILRHRSHCRTGMTKLSFESQCFLKTRSGSEMRNTVIFI